MQVHDKANRDVIAQTFSAADSVGAWSEPRSVARSVCQRKIVGET